MCCVNNGCRARYSRSTRARPVCCVNNGCRARFPLESSWKISGGQTKGWCGSGIGFVCTSELSSRALHPGVDSGLARNESRSSLLGARRLAQSVQGRTGHLLGPESLVRASQGSSPGSGSKATRAFESPFFDPHMEPESSLRGPSACNLIFPCFCKYTVQRWGMS